MDYTLLCFYADGSFVSHTCATLTDVTNIMHSIMRSQEKPDIAAKTVQFHIQFDHKG